MGMDRVKRLAQGGAPMSNKMARVGSFVDLTSGSGVVDAEAKPHILDNGEWWFVRSSVRFSSAGRASELSSTFTRGEKQCYLSCAARLPRDWFFLFPILSLRGEVWCPKRVRLRVATAAAIGSAEARERTRDGRPRSSLGEPPVNAGPRLGQTGAGSPFFLCRLSTSSAVPR